MRATIEWSHRRLDDDARNALARLSTFAGGFARSAADEVTDAGTALDRLVEASVVSRDGDRFRLLEPIRQFASTELARSGERAVVRAAHAAWVGRLVSDVGGATPRERLVRLGAEHDNVEAAMAYALEHDPALAATIAHWAAVYWARRDWAAGRRWVERTLEVADALDGRTRADLHVIAGDRASAQGSPVDALTHLERAVDLFRTADDPRAHANALSSLGAVYLQVGDPAAARERLEASVALHRELGPHKGLGVALGNLGMLLHTLGDDAGARDLLTESVDELRSVDGLDPDADLLGNVLLALGLVHGGEWTVVRTYAEEALEVFTTSHNEAGRCQALTALAEVDHRQRLLGTARRRLDEALAISERLNDRAGVAEALQHIGDLHRPDEIDVALDYHRRAIEIHREIGAPWPLAFSLTRVAFVEAQSGDAVATARCFGEAEAMWEAAAVPPFPYTEMDEELAWMKETLGEDGFRREWEVGRAAANLRAS